MFSILPTLLPNASFQSVPFRQHFLAIVISSIFQKDNVDQTARDLGYVDIQKKGGGGTHITAHHVHREDGVSPDGSIIAAGKFYSIV